MKTKEAIELILMPKVFYTFKELKSKTSILFSFCRSTGTSKTSHTIWLTRGPSAQGRIRELGS